MALHRDADTTAIGFLAGAFVGLMGCICGRLAMRAVATTGGAPPAFTPEGTLPVISV